MFCMHGNLINLTGHKFGQLTVLEQAPNKGRWVMWSCRCSCGIVKAIRGGSLTSGNTTSCGCVGVKKRAIRAKRRGPEHPRWTGGRSMDKRGYVRVYIEGHAPGTPRYRLEHVLVMEENIGRVLFPGETVHHKNGIRHDNRIENLELWSSNHGPGQRVKDKVKWAIEILKLYAPSIPLDNYPNMW